MVTYGILAEKMGYEGAGVLDKRLGHVAFYCEQNDLPPLTVIVVNQETGLPGRGFPGDELHATREQVFNFDWYGLFPPTPEELDAAHRAAKS